MSDDLTFGVRLDGESNTMVSSTQAATAGMVELKTATEQLTTALDQQKISAEKYAEGVMDMGIAESNAKDKAWALANGYKDVGGSMVKTAEEVAGGMEKTSFATNRAMTEMAVLAREVGRGNFSRLPGTLSIIAQGLGPVGWAVAGVTAAVGAGVYAWMEWGDASAKASEKAQDALDAAQKAADKSKHMNIPEQIAAIQSEIGDTERANLNLKYANNITAETDSLQKYMALTMGDQPETIAKTFATIEANNQRIENLKRNAQDLADKIKPDKPQDDGSAKILADAQRQDKATLDSHLDALGKWVEAWKTTEDLLVSLGARGTQARAEHEAAYTVYVNAENLKRNAAADAAAAKQAAAEAQRQTVELINENAHAALMDAAAGQIDNTVRSKEIKSFQDEIINYQKRFELAQVNHQLSLAEEEAFQTELDAIMRRHHEQQNIDGEAAFTQQLATAGTQFRVMFEINKEWQTAQAVIAGYKAVQDAYAWGSTWGGPVGGAAMAAVAFAATAANVMAIQHAQFGGGAGMNGAGGGSGGAPVTTPSPLAPASPQASTPSQTAPPPAQTTIYLMGNVLTPDFVDQYVLPNVPDYLKNTISNNDFVLIDPRSRQAQMLNPA